MNKKCDHYIGAKDYGYDGYSLLEESCDYETLDKEFDIIFKYCPMCGEELK